MIGFISVLLLLLLFDLPLLNAPVIVNCVRIMITIVLLVTGFERVMAIIITVTIFFPFAIFLKVLDFLSFQGV